MIDQYFGVKELYEVVLRAKVPMQFGSRFIEEGEPVLYFENINMAAISEKNNTIMARGGWANMPRVIWEDRSEVGFYMSEGVMSSISMSILLSANVANEQQNDTPLLIPKREIQSLTTFIDKNDNNKKYQVLYLHNKPVFYPQKKIFIFEYSRDVAQKKVYGKPLEVNDPLGRTCLAIFEDKELKQNADNDKEYLVDYYYEYRDEALIYVVQKERFNGLFTLEGKFYSKDENEGLNYTNLIYMPKVRVVSDINLRLGERADPAVSTFNIIGLPENVGGNKKSLIMEITRLNSDEDGNI